MNISLRFQQIVRRVHESLPQYFPSVEPDDYTVVRDNVGIRPERRGGIRVEKEIVNGQKVVHAYGAQGGGYVFSGLSREAAKLVNEYVFELPSAKL